MYTQGTHMAEAWLRSRANSMDGGRMRSRGPRWTEDDANAVRTVLAEIRKLREGEPKNDS